MTTGAMVMVICLCWSCLVHTFPRVPKRACPKLTKFHWQHESIQRCEASERGEDIAMNNQIYEIFITRGGEFHHEWL